MLARNIQKAGECVRFLSKLFLNAKISEPVESAKYIVAHALNKKMISQCNPNVKLTKVQTKAIEKMSEMRLSHMPIQYIVGEWDFSGLELSMKKPVFIPRPETEELVAKILEYKSPNERAYFLEVGCGSGAVSLALLSKLPQARCVAIDINPDAVMLTKHNALKNDLLQRIEVVNISFDDFVKTNYLQLFDFIVSNPPYIPTQEIASLQKDVVLHEDIRALDGGADGMDLIRKIIEASHRLVRNEGSIWLETDLSHDELLKDMLLKESKVVLHGILNDFTKRPRFCHMKVLH